MAIRPGKSKTPSLPQQFTPRMGHELASVSCPRNLLHHYVKRDAHSRMTQVKQEVRSVDVVDVAVVGIGPVAWPRISNDEPVSAELESRLTALVAAKKLYVLLYSRTCSRQNCQYSEARSRPFGARCVAGSLQLGHWQAGRSVRKRRS